MRTRSLLALLLLAPASALAQTPAATPTPTATATTAPAATTTAANPNSASPYAMAMQEGRDKIREGNFPGAQLAFQRAVSLDHEKAEAHYYLGVCQRHQGSMTHALESFRHAITKAERSNDLRTEAQARFALADTMSTMDTHHGHEAHEAWTALVTFAEAHPDVLTPDIPRAYLAARQRVTELAETMAPVRERIRAREHEAARTHGAR